MIVYLLHISVIAFILKVGQNQCTSLSHLLNNNTRFKNLIKLFLKPTSLKNINTSC